MLASLTLATWELAVIMMNKNIKKTRNNNNNKIETIN